MCGFEFSSIFLLELFPVWEKFRLLNETFLPFFIVNQKCCDIIDSINFILCRAYDVCSIFTKLDFVSPNSKFIMTFIKLKVFTDPCTLITPLVMQYSSTISFHSWQTSLTILRLASSHPTAPFSESLRAKSLYFLTQPRNIIRPKGFLIHLGLCLWNEHIFSMNIFSSRSLLLEGFELCKYTKKIWWSSCNN